MKRRTFLGLAAAAPFILRHRIADALVDPAVVGSWGPRLKLPHIAIHMAHLSGTGQLLMAANRVVSTLGTKAWTWDPATNIITDCTLKTYIDFMCGGGIIDEHGAPRFYGGLNGNDRSFRFVAANVGSNDPTRPAWTEGKKLSLGRYYPTTTRGGYSVNYPAGFIITAVGRINSLDIYGAHDYDYTTRMTRMPASANLLEVGYQQQYPRLHLLPDPNGRLLMVGCERAIKVLNVDAATWTTIGTMMWERRYEGCATRLPGDGNEFLLTGGDVVATNKRQQRFNALTRVGRETASLILPRKQANTVILPDGRILVLGGRGAPEPNAPELYDPNAETSTLMADTPLKTLINGVLVSDKPAFRGYHSSSALLRDGRVIWAGGIDGTKGYSCELFTPPQLYRGPRPDLSITPGTEQTTYGGLVTFSSTTPELVNHIALIRHYHNSHGHNGEQQHYKLPTLVLPQDGTVQATVPTGRNLAPPGWYTAYALSPAGVWSTGTDIRIA